MKKAAHPAYVLLFFTGKPENLSGHVNSEGSLTETDIVEHDFPTCFFLE